MEIHKVPLPRRTHQKSRLGCANCKRRRIKCDERKPICSNCATHAIECTFSNPGNANCKSPLITTHRFRPYRPASAISKKQHSKGSEAEDSPRISTNSIGTQCDFDLTSRPSPAPGQSPILFADLGLLHHFTISTYRSLVDNPTISHLWQIEFVGWGMTFHSILHLILALSALHLGYENPNQRHQYVQQADDHFTFGVRSITAVLAQLSEESCQKVYISAVLICIVYFARGPRTGEYLVFSDQGVSEWRVLMNGVKLILQSYRDQIFTGILKPEINQEELSVSPLLRSELDEHILHIQGVQQLVDQELLTESDNDIYTAAIKDLLAVLNEVYEKRSAQKLPVGLMQVLIGWVYRLPGELTSQLEQKEPLALILLAHWAVLLKYMQSVWFMKGWDAHVVTGVRSSLEAEFHPWIEWPIQRIQED
ncbi:Oleate activated transcription factor 3 [Talaromyces islandicus]|uniref:Oleate activated transcription factor 3 n=1 Tax=Talaromyces islandicus TaxID=28573 RepID=A0A0U1LX35_TALIS|nr:Oleate activated transcription factor 3 [Talaromyces islandicus]